MLTLDYTFYRDVFKGSCSEDQFNANMPKAGDMLALLMSSEPESMSENVKRAYCYAIDYEQMLDCKDDTNFESEKLDDYSYTRGSTLSKKASAIMQKIIGLLGYEGLYSARVEVYRKTRCCQS